MRLFNICFLQKRSRIRFNESGEEEMQNLWSIAPVCPIAMLGGPTWQRMLGLGLSTLLALELVGAFSAAEAPEAGMETLSELVDREIEIPKENAPTSDVLPKEDAVNSGISIDPDHFCN